MKRDPENKRESKGERTGFATAQLSKKKLFGLRQPDRKSLSVNE